MSLKKLLFEFAGDEELTDLEKIDQDRIIYAQLKRKADDKFEKISSGLWIHKYAYSC